eukprot:Opistho-2@57150
MGTYNTLNCQLCKMASRPFRFFLLAILLLATAAFGFLISLYVIERDGSVRQDRNEDIVVDELLRRVTESEKIIRDQRRALADLNAKAAAIAAVPQQRPDRRVVPVPAVAEPHTKDDDASAPARKEWERAIPILVISCNRVEITRCLDTLLRYRPSDKFPIIVSQDCGDPSTANVIRDKYGTSVIHLQQPDLSNIRPAPNLFNFVGYYKISRHYKWALTQVLDVLYYDSVIIVEDDLDISPDFFSYFASTRPLLDSDPSLFCVSAWNDNGKPEFIADKTRLFRSDFFPGLGWMLTRDTWRDWAAKWPPAFWDDWVREPDQRKGRACIRPEVSRVQNFGRVGVSGGQFFDSHIAKIRKNEDAVDFGALDLSYLTKAAYDPELEKEVFQRATEVSVDDVMAGRITCTACRVTYTDNNDFERIANQLGLMSDRKAGVPRMAYNGVVSIAFRGTRLHIAPRPNWQGYVKDP